MLLLHGLLYALGLYALLGIVTAVLFVSFGVTQVLPYSMTHRRAHPGVAGRRRALALRACALAEIAQGRMRRARTGPRIGCSGRS